LKGDGLASLELLDVERFRSGWEDSYQYNHISLDITEDKRENDDWTL
jgi:hypothetical protein